ncbi:hypothetical protein NFD58_12610 [Staphylococcus epidermidis]|nr:hypothetical protein [Staphylococcus epidermidis]
MPDNVIINNKYSRMRNVHVKQNALTNRMTIQVLKIMAQGIPMVKGIK